MANVWQQLKKTYNITFCIKTKSKNHDKDFRITIVNIVLL